MYPQSCARINTALCGRAFYPVPRAAIQAYGKDIKYDVPENLEPGKVLAVDESSVLIKAGTGYQVTRIHSKCSVEACDYL